MINAAALVVVMLCCFMTDCNAQDSDTRFRVRGGQLQVTTDSGHNWRWSGVQEYSSITGFPSYYTTRQRTYYGIGSHVLIPSPYHTYNTTQYGANGQVTGRFYGGGFGLFRWNKCHIQSIAVPGTITLPVYNTYYPY